MFLSDVFPGYFCFPCNLLNYHDFSQFSFMAVTGKKKNMNLITLRVKVYPRWQYLYGYLDTWIAKLSWSPYSALGCRPCIRSYDVIYRLIEYQNPTCQHWKISKTLIYLHLGKKQINSLDYYNKLLTFLPLPCIVLLLCTSHFMPPTTYRIFFICIPHFSSNKVSSPKARVECCPTSQYWIFKRLNSHFQSLYILPRASYTCYISEFDFCTGKKEIIIIASSLSGCRD